MHARLGNLFDVPLAASSACSLLLHVYMYYVITWYFLKHRFCYRHEITDCTSFPSTAFLVHIILQRAALNAAYDKYDKWQL